MGQDARLIARRAALLLVLASCADEAPHARVPSPAGKPIAKTAEFVPVPASRVSYIQSLAASCSLVVPFYEGLRFAPASAALLGANSKYLDLAYPGALSIPMVAWQCGSDPWTSVTIDKPLTTPVQLEVRAELDHVDVRLECFGACEFVEARGGAMWESIAEKTARGMKVHAQNPPLASRYDAMDFFVRQWVSDHDLPARRDDWSKDALAARMKTEPAGHMSFVFGIDPNEVDLGGKYFWSDGARDEIEGIFRANPNAAQFHWLNLRTYKTEIPRISMSAPPPPEIVAAEKKTKNAREFDQYVFKAVEMCLASETWQRSRIEEMQKLLDLGFKIVALDEFPTARTWDAEPCEAIGHLHKPNDFADETRITFELVKKLADMAHAKGALLSSEEPSLMLLPYASGYMDGAFDDPPDMYDHWKVDGVTRIPLFSTMFGKELTPYTRVAKSHAAPAGWIVQEQISGPR